MTSFEWTPDYSVSVERFDEEHKMIFTLINQLQEAIRKGEARAVVQQVLDELTSYTAQHFEAEEGAMRRAGYLGLAQHIAEHQGMTAALAKFQADLDVKKDSLAPDLLLFLRKWLQRHILVSDRKYVDSLRSVRTPSS